jgi:hypothetical protein
MTLTTTLFLLSGVGMFQRALIKKCMPRTAKQRQPRDVVYPSCMSQQSHSKREQAVGSKKHLILFSTHFHNERLSKYMSFPV